MKKKSLVLIALTAGLVAIADEENLILGDTIGEGSGDINHCTIIGRNALKSSSQVYDTHIVGNSAMSMSTNIYSSIAIGNGALAGANDVCGTVAIGQNELLGVRHLHDATSINERQFFATALGGGVFAINPTKAKKLTQSALWWHNGTLNINGNVNWTGTSPVAPTGFKRYTDSIVKRSEGSVASTNGTWLGQATRLDIRIRTEFACNTYVGNPPPNLTSGTGDIELIIDEYDLREETPALFSSYTNSFNSTINMTGGSFGGEAETLFVDDFWLDGTTCKAKVRIDIECPFGGDVMNAGVAVKIWEPYTETEPSDYAFVGTSAAQAFPSESDFEQIVQQNVGFIWDADNSRLTVIADGWEVGSVNVTPIGQ